MGIRKDETTRETLPEYVSRVMEESNLSTFEVERRGGPTHGTVHNIMRGHTKNVKRETLMRLAHALGRPPDELIAVAFGTRPEKSREFRDAFLNSLCADYQELSAKDQEYLLPYLQMIRQQIDQRKTKK